MNLQIIFSNRTARICCCFLITLMLISGLYSSQNNILAMTNITPFPDLGAEAVVVIDATTGKILFEQNKDQTMYPASTTKLMTAILTVENLDLAGEVIIDKETAEVGGSSMNLVEGEIITVMNLLKGLLIVSGNDTALALAKAISGDAVSFATLMNEKAMELGAINTNFSNPNGLHDDFHYTTAHDMSLIAKATLDIPVLRTIVGLPTDIIPATNLVSQRTMTNSNQLLGETPYKYDGANGVKTGYTPEAGSCLAASAKRGNTEFIVVVLNSSDLGRFGDCTILLDYAFANYKTVTAIEREANVGTVKVKRGEFPKVQAVAKETVAVNLPINASDDIVSTKFVADENIEAPIKKGDKVGVVNSLQVGEVVGKVDAIALNDVEVGGPLSILGISDKTAEILKVIAIAVVLLLIILLWIYILLKRKQIRRKKQRRLEREEQKRKTPQEELRDTWNSNPRHYEKSRRQ